MANATGIITRLPAELIIAILDYLVPVVDKHSLVKCSGTTPLWREVLAPHIFHTIRIDNTRPDHSLSHFVELLNNSPSICRHIQSLSIYGASSSGFQSVSLIPLMQILSTLDSLHDLKLDGINWVQPRQNRSKTRLTCSIGPLETLVLRNCRHNGRKCRTKDVFQLLAPFSCIRTLDLDQIFCSEPSQAKFHHMTSSPYKLVLEQLELGSSFWRSDDSMQHFFDALRARIVLAGLRKLDIRCQNRAHLLIVGAFMQEVKLTELSLIVSTMESYLRIGHEPVWASLGLESQTALKSLCIHVWTSGEHEFEHVNDSSLVYTGQWCLCSALDILTYAPPTVEHITIFLTVSGNVYNILWHLIHEFSWPGLQAQFKRIDALKTADFEIRVRTGVDMTYEICLLVSDVLHAKLSEFGYKIKCSYLRTTDRMIEGLKVAVRF